VHVAFVIFRAEPSRGGAERYVDQLGHALIARGHRVTALASALGELGELGGVKIAAGGMTRTGRYRRFLANLDAHLARQRYDVVHACLPVKQCDVYHAHAGLEATSLSESHRIKTTLAGQATSMLGHRVNRKRRAFAAVEATLLNGPTPPFTICLSDRERLNAERLFPSAKAKLVTLHSAPDDAKFSDGDLKGRRKHARRQLGIGADQPVFLFVGQDFRRKGLAIAIRALGQLRDTHAVLYVLGSGDIAKYSKLAMQSHVLGRVLFAGSVGDISTFVAAADALVLPSRYEPFGMVAVEAMLMGVPPIISAVSGASEVVADDRTGYVIADPDDVPAWTVAMTRVLAPATRGRLSAACIAERGRFSYAAHVDAIEALHRRAAAGRSPAQGR
jgi:UDP-glucose:(heptosyl)LPS alpha-1,3-glucosyltransferase